MHIQITTSTFGKAGNKPVDYLKKNGVEFKVNPYQRKLTEEEAILLLQGVKGVIAGTEPYTKKVLANLPDLKIISRCGIATDNIDLGAAREHGIQILNTPDLHVDAVAELALAGTLTLMRKLSVCDKDIRTGHWKKKMGRSLYQKKVGLIGYGKVARRFEQLLSPFTRSISYYDPFIDHPGGRTSRFTDLDELLVNSDLISVHIPFSRENEHLIGVEAFKKMKTDVVIINTSRGGLIDENALHAFLQSNPEAAAYLDVFRQEPYSGSLIDLENVLMSPHIATTTKETREEMEYQACVNLLNNLQNG